ncbi:MAG: recombinase family protein, partial [Oscillibacter sp.]|nr:recombinase family protein [Oscillibacter sp.]
YEWIDGRLTIIPEEAETVRFMYREYMKGASRIEIGRTLNEKGIYTRQGKEWVDSNVKVVLTNITYTGNMLFQKEYVADPIAKHRKKNRGELPQYFVEGTHEAIIPMKEFQAVQAEFKRRRDLGPFGNKSLHLTAFSTKITCGICGKHYRRSGKRNTAGEVYYIWTCQTKSQKGANVCSSKNIPEKMLQNVAAKVMGLADFDETAFTVQVEEILVVSEDTLRFRFYDGREVTTTWESTAKTDWWTPERRRLWGERHKRKDTNPNKSTYYEFTGFIKCGCCGANYRCQSNVRKDGTRTRSWYCTGPKDKCQNTAIRDETMKALVTEALDLPAFDEEVMDAQIEYASILEGTVTFHFRDGHKIFNTYQDKRRGVKWSAERREKQCQAIKDKSTVLDTSDLDAEKTALEQEMVVISEIMQQSIYENARVALDQTAYQKHYDGLTERFGKAKARLEEVTAAISDKATRQATIEDFLKELQTLDGMITEFDPMLWVSLVDFVTVYSKDDVRITFKNGTEIKA